MEPLRSPFQGVWNIIRFNWHFYLSAAGFVLLILFANQYVSASIQLYANIILLLILGSTAISLIVSYYIYDLSDLYQFDWLSALRITSPNRIANIHAGFDETSSILKNKFPEAELDVLDFYDPKTHTEPSIKRARTIYPPFPMTQQITTSHIPLSDNSTDLVFLILAAHEIRNEQERSAFFEEINRILKHNGQLIVMEHQRNLANFLVYNLGCFHFYSTSVWKRIFQEANLTIAKQISVTPFIKLFVLEKNGTTP